MVNPHLRAFSVFAINLTVLGIGFWVMGMAFLIVLVALLMLTLFVPMIMCACMAAVDHFSDYTIYGYDLDDCLELFCENTWEVWFKFTSLGYSFKRKGKE